MQLFISILTIVIVEQNFIVWLKVSDNTGEKSIYLQIELHDNYLSYLSNQKHIDVTKEHNTLLFCYICYYLKWSCININIGHCFSITGIWQWCKNVHYLNCS